MEQLAFECSMNGQTWEGKITRSKAYGSHFYIEVSAKGSGITVYFGKAVGGWFVCIPNWDAGLLIGSLRDIGYNAEKVGFAMKNEIDGLSVACALNTYAESNCIEEKDDTAEIIEMLKKAGFSRAEE